MTLLDLEKPFRRNGVTIWGNLVALTELKTEASHPALGYSRYGSVRHSNGWHDYCFVFSAIYRTDYVAKEIVPQISWL